MMEVLFFVLLIYFLPTLVAYDLANRGQIFILNLFLGWTLLGWVIALIWACKPRDNKDKKN